MDYKRKSIRAKFGGDFEMEAVKAKDRERRLFITRDRSHIKLLNLSNLEYHLLAEMTTHKNVIKSFYQNFNDNSLKLCLLKHNVADNSLEFHILNYSL